MSVIDDCVDKFEVAVATSGVENVDPTEFAPHSRNLATDEYAAIVVELLRVWMEHSWNSGIAITAEDCLSKFPHVKFSDSDREALLSEEDRQREIVREAQQATAPPETPSFPLPGTEWQGFSLLTDLGQGAFSRVFLARQIELAGRLVVLKLTTRPSSESYWLATLQHSSIVPVYSTIFHEGLYGICMPFLGNTTLQDIVHAQKRTTSKPTGWWRSLDGTRGEEENAILSTVRDRNRDLDTVVETEAEPTPLETPSSNHKSSERGTAIPVSQGLLHHSVLSKLGLVRSVTWIGARLAEALAYAHQRGVIHSDIKPANVLVARDGTPMLLDFNVSYASTPDRAGHIRNGRSKAEGTKGRGTKSSVGYQGEWEPMGGTLPYMAPELKRRLRQNTQTDLVPVDGRSDIYSLGCILYEMLNGRLPTLQTDEQERVWVASIPPALRAIINKCLRADPNERYPTAQALFEDLDAQHHNLPLVHQSEPSVRERAIKWALRHPRWTSSLSVGWVAALVIASLIGLVMVRDRAARESEWQTAVASVGAMLPETMAMLSSSRVEPAVQPAAEKQFHQTIQLLGSASNKHPSATRNTVEKVNPRWFTDPKIPENLRRDLQAVAYLANAQGIPCPSELVVDEGRKANDSLTLQSLILVQHKRYEEAQRALESAVESNPRDFFAWWLLGDCYHALGKTTRAEQAYTACIALQPQVGIAYFNRGMARFTQGDFAAAAGDYELAAKRSPSWFACHLNRALALQHSGKVNEAVAVLRQGIEEGYKSVSAYRLLSELYGQLQQENEKLAAWDNALSIEPLTEQEWVDRGLMELESDPKASVASFEHALERNPESINAREKLAYVHSELLADPDASMKRLDELVALAPDLPRHRAARGVLAARLGKLELAIEDAMQLERMRLSEPIVMYQVACIYSLIGSHNPSLPEVLPKTWKWLSQALRNDGDLAQLLPIDPDMSWLRSQSGYSDRLATTLNVLGIDLSPNSNQGAAP